MLATVTIVDQRGPTPLYVQLAAILRAEIESGGLADLEPIPSETYLQEQHGVSRVTVRKAVVLLRDQGLVYTIQAWGTFVRRAD
jgi:DNA-binding GntR family transcriptional regulator